MLRLVAVDHVLRKQHRDLKAAAAEGHAAGFIDGRLDRTLRGDGLVQEFIDILEDYVARRFPAPV